MTRRMILVVLAALACMVALGVWSGRGPQDRQLLREVYSPSFADIPGPESLSGTIAHLRADLASPAGQNFLARLLPDQAGVLWITLIVALVVAVDFARLRNGRNVDIIVAIALGAAFFDVMHFFGRGVVQVPAYVRLLDLVFTAVVALNATLLIRAVWHAVVPLREALWRPNLRGRALAALALLLLALNVLLALQREPDDAGYFINLGAQRLRERGQLPFGDPLLTGTPGAAYGPVLYAAHVPFQFIIEPRSPNVTSTAHPPLGQDATYYLPPPFATKLCTIAFHLAGVLALFVAGVRLTGDRDVGWGLVALYCGSAFVLGVGGETEFIGGMTFVSHIAPAALTLMAFACLGSPALAGSLLAVSVGAGFYPAFMFPAWMGYFWRDRRHCVRFVAAFAVAAAIIGGGTYALSRPADGRSRIGTILNDTFGHHTDPAGYGRSPFGFWGQRQGIRRWMTTPLVGQSGLTTPAYAIFFGLVGATFFIGRRTSATGLALLTGAIAIAASLVKIQPTGSYVAWGYPFLLIGIFASGQFSTAAYPAEGSPPPTP